MMSNFYELLKRRRSIRQYTEAPIDKEILKQLARAALMSPSSKSRTPWEFVIVQNKDMLQKLSECRPHGSALVAKAAACFVILADTAKTDVWVEDASIAAILLQLQAEDLGLGSCWVQVRTRDTENGTSANEYIKDLLDIPSNMEVLCMIALGYKNEERKGFDDNKLKMEKVHWDKY